jgi:hypothetical protein
MRPAKRGMDRLDMGYLPAALVGASLSCRPLWSIGRRQNTKKTDRPNEIIGNNGRPT